MNRYLLLLFMLTFYFSGNTQKNLREVDHSGYVIISDLNKETLARSTNISTENIEEIWQEIGMYYTKTLSDTQKKIINENPAISFHINRTAELRNIPNDPMYIDQYFHEMVKTTELWKITTGNETSAGDKIVIGVLDSGFDLKHEDLKDNVWYNIDEIPGNKIDDDNNGYVDDVNGYDFFFNKAEIPVASHGTGVMGIIGARGNNTTGITGVLWDAKVMTLAPARREVDIVKALKYARDLRKKYNESDGKEGSFIVAINNSWGFSKTQATELPALCMAYDELLEEGILAVVATPNSSFDIGIEGDLPSSCSSQGIISVLGVTTAGIYDRASGYNIYDVDIGSPTTNILTTQPDTQYIASSGTSYATPIITGNIGLLYASLCDSLVSEVTSDPKRIALLVKEAIIKNVQIDDSLADKCSSGGYLDALEAYKYLQENCGVKIYEQASINNLYPNPSEIDELNVILQLPQKDGFRITIYDMMGKRIKEIKIEGVYSDVDFLVNISEFQSGTYILELTGPDTEISKKFIVL